MEYQGKPLRKNSELLSKVKLSIQGRGHQLAEQLGLQKKGKAFYCPHPENHNHGDRRPSFSINNDTGSFKCWGASCGISGSLVKLAAELGSNDPWRQIVQLCGISLTAEEERHLENLSRKGVIW